MRWQRLFLLAVICLAVPVLFRLASVALTPAVMQHYVTILVGHVRWLRLTPDGIRVCSSVLMVIGIVGVIAALRALIVRCMGLGAWGSLQLVVALGLGAGGYFEWRADQINLWWAIGMGFASWVLISRAMNNIRLGRWMTWFNAS